MKKLINLMLGKKKNSDIPKILTNEIPKGWYVSEAGQDPLYMLWYVVLMNFDDVSKGIDPPRYFVSEEKDTFEQALKECIEKCF